MPSWVYIIGVFAAVFVVMLIVGFIGNKAVDKTENALCSKRISKQNNDTVYSGQSESLADRFSASENIQFPQMHRALFCTECGEKLLDNCQFCPKCGTKVNTYTK